MNDFDVDIRADENGFVSNGGHGTGFASNIADPLDFFFNDSFAHAQQATEALDLETGLAS